MIRLDRRGWNNVLIFASLTMILLFNGVHNKLLNNEPELGSMHAVFPSEQILLTLDMPGVSIERVGRGWRANPAKQYTEQQLEKLIVAWQAMQGELLSATQAAAYQVNTHPDYVVTAWFAGQRQGYVLQIYVEQTGLLINDIQQDVWLRVDDAKLDTLFIN
ncbi:hypothetical protein C2869_10935 [Saccharobesus litoralis]|uniref:Uncharacterized protein n=1 Tax=Saccharobesus litoralis TaxID=2172099 RepID=A0A2S0VRS9_9ALTE|nr:hypothetical protein [Saccharobesus litoralis]AWB66918.1 hypothetical protein C2869_10935 [Saccharobesus litoralis]